MCLVVEFVRNLVAHDDAREGKWRGNWRKEWVASTLTPPPSVAYPALLKLMRTPRLPSVDWTDSPTDLNGLGPFRGKTKSGLWACAIRFRTSSNDILDGLACRLTLFLIKGETSQDRVWNVRLYRGKSYGNKQSGEDIVTEVASWWVLSLHVCV